MDLTQSLFSVLVALCATFQLSHSAARSSFCKGRHPKLCHVHIGKRTFFTDGRDLSVPTTNIDPNSPAARLLAAAPPTIDLAPAAANFLPAGEGELLQTSPQLADNEDEDMEVLFDSHPRKMRILRLIQEIMNSSLEQR